MAGGTNFFDFQQSLLAQARRPAAAAAKPANGPTAAVGIPDALTVTQLTQQIDRALKAGLPASVSVRGEVSNYKHHGSSGHAYFTLKDTDACIDCVMFKGDFAKLKFKPSDGLELLATGRVGVYGQRGRYQLYVSALQPVGQGALELAFQQLRARLEREGLFERSRKKRLPRFPQHLALVTSKETAALQDMLKVLRRFAFLKLSIYHVPVQGDGSAEQISAAIHHLNREREDFPVDLILLARGGGSLEDLWQFNEEIVARAICASEIPVVTGIGHEVDVSIADLVADYHAHTPTEAAQVVTAHWRQARDALDTTDVRLRRCVRDFAAGARQRLTHVERHELFRRPLDRVNSLRQFLDDREKSLGHAAATRLHLLQRRLSEIARRLDRHRPGALLARLRQRLDERQHALDFALHARLRLARRRVDALDASLRERHPRHALSLLRHRLDSAAVRLNGATRASCQSLRRQLDSFETQLRLVGPEQVLQRGYSITTHRKTGQVLRSAAQLKPGDRIVTRLADGQVESTADDPNQPRLFD